MQIKYSFLLINLLISLSVSSVTYIIQPKAGTQGPQAALIFVNGAQIPNTGYDTLMRQIQEQSKINLWIGLPGFAVLDTPNPLEIKSAIEGTLNQLYAAGLDKNAPIFYSGHSLGSIFVQDYLQGNNINAKGLILTGGYIQRKYLWPELSFKVPTLTVGGELDGLSRITRITEAYYTLVKRLNKPADFPVIVVPKINHFQFAGQGDIPFLVKERDLMSETTQQDAWDKISAAYIDFILQKMGLSNGAYLNQKMSETLQMITPIISAFELEGHKNFNSPKQIGGPLESTCVKGGCDDQSPWIPQVQELIGANIPGWTVEAQNKYVSLSSTPITGQEFHLPVITSDAQNKKISVTTFAQGEWELLDSQDTGFFPISAKEIGAKMASRQCLIIQGTNTPKEQVPFSVDDPNFCRLANEKTYQWALDISNESTRTRFQQYGTKYVFADDISKQGGPLFLYSHVQYDNVTLNTGEKAVQISSPEQKTEIDYWEDTFHIPRPSWIPDPGCYHYCKVLSPARAIEWIYVDSLREKRSI